MRSLADLHDVLVFFEARRGSLHAFRFRDPFDMKSCRPEETISAADQIQGTGDGIRARFPLIKTYGSGGDAFQRLITKPVLAGLRIAVAGDEQASPGDYSFDAETGEIVFTPGAVPGDGDMVTAGYEFDVPVRFDTERLSISLTAFKAGQIPSIPLVEVRL